MTDRQERTSIEMPMPSQPQELTEEEEIDRIDAIVRTLAEVGVLDRVLKGGSIKEALIDDTVEEGEESSSSS